MPWLLAMTLLVAAMMLVTHIYLGWRLWKISKNISNRNAIKWLPVLFFVSFYLLPSAGLIQLAVGGQPDLLKYPKWLTYWFWFGFIFSFHLLTWIILLDILKIIINAVTKFRRERIFKFYSKIVLTVTVVLFVFTAAKMWHDTTQIDIKYSSVEDESIPKGFDDLRLVHISDLQGDEYTGRKDIARYIQKVNRLNPDLVVFTGDLISYGTDFIDIAAEELSKVKATYGLYAVIGDHDYWTGVNKIQAAYQKYGVNLLRNENKIITVQGDSLLMTGITEVYSKHIKRDLLQQLAAANKDVSFEIMATHQATEKVIEIAQKHNYEILLGGHTHGGQIRVPLFFMHFSAPSFETDYLSGPFKLGDLLLNINNGLGFTLAPVRYDAQPSISVIDVE